MHITLCCRVAAHNHKLCLSIPHNSFPYHHTFPTKPISVLDATLCDTIISATIDSHPAVSMTYSKARFVAENYLTPMVRVQRNRRCAQANLATLWLSFSIWPVYGLRIRIGMRDYIRRFQIVWSLTRSCRAVTEAGKNLLRRWFSLMTWSSHIDVSRGVADLEPLWRDSVLLTRVLSIC
jgi:hypothetical protein